MMFDFGGNIGAGTELVGNYHNGVRLPDIYVHKDCTDFKQDGKRVWANGREYLPDANGEIHIGEKP